MKPALILDEKNEGIDVAGGNDGLLIRHYTRQSYAHVIDREILVPDASVKLLGEAVEAYCNEKSPSLGSVST